MGHMPSSYLHALFEYRNLNPIIETLTIKLQPHIFDFDAIACRGLSGLLVATTVANNLHKNIIVSRKSGNTHSKKSLEGFDNQRYIIIDDFIASGDTIKTIVEDIESTKGDFEPIGVILYQQNMLYDTDEVLMKKYKFKWCITKDNFKEYSNA